MAAVCGTPVSVDEVGGNCRNPDRALQPIHPSMDMPWIGAVPLDVLAADRTVVRFATERTRDEGQAD